MALPPMAATAAYLQKAISMHTLHTVPRGLVWAATNEFAKTNGSGLASSAPKGWQKQKQYC